MCFVVHPDLPNPQIAEADISCVKEGTVVSDTHHFISLFHGYPYKFQQLQPRVNLHPVNRNIQEGYHSWSVDHFSLQCPPDEGRVRVKCIIPKGSLYYYNPEFQEFVSDQIIVQEIL